MKPFSPEADAVIENALAWLGRRQLEQSEPVVPYRFYRPGMAFSEADAKMLRDMAQSATWVERGGMGTGYAGQVNPRGFKRQEEINESGAGRTHWLGMPEWARGFGMDRDAIKATVEKAIAGEHLGRKQALLVQSMLEVVAQINATVIPF